MKLCLIFEGQDEQSGASDADDDDADESGDDVDDDSEEEGDAVKENGEEEEVTKDGYVVFVITGCRVITGLWLLLFVIIVVDEADTGTWDSERERE